VSPSNTQVAIWSMHGIVRADEVLAFGNGWSAQGGFCLVHSEFLPSSDSAAVLLPVALSARLRGLVAGKVVPAWKLLWVLMIWLPL
jgi:hypothetical protein